MLYSLVSHVVMEDCPLSYRGKSQGAQAGEAPLHCRQTLDTFMEIYSDWDVEDGCC